MPSSLRTLTVDAGTQRAVGRDLLRHVLTRPGFVVVWAVCLAVTVAAIVVAATGRSVSPFVFAAAFGVVGLPLGMLLGVRRAVRRSLPVGGTVGAQVGSERLTLQTAGGLGQVGYGTYRDVMVGRDAIVLVGDRSLRSPETVVLVGRTSVAQALPRALFSDDDLAVLRSRVGATAVAA